MVSHQHQIGMESCREPAVSQVWMGTYPGIGHSSCLDQNDPLHELDSGYSDACGDVLSIHHFQYLAFRAVQYVPLLSVISIRTPVKQEMKRGISMKKVPTR